MEGRTIGRQAHLYVLRLAIGAIVLALSFKIAPAQVRVPGILPHATIISDERDTARNGEASADEDVPPAISSPPHTEHLHPHHHTALPDPLPLPLVAVEPTHAMLKLKKDTSVYASPEPSSHPLERVREGRFLNVTGSTHYYLQVKLKNGATGYVPLSAVDLIHPEDKLMRLTTDASVLSQPNRYGKKLSEVHEGHDVHVIGVSMNYVRIRMRSGLEGYIPMTAAE
jgi:hypothetical protein